MTPEGFRERLGDAVGTLGAPLIERISRARHGRTFHPEGMTFEAHVEALRPGLAEELGDRALVRLSPALWRGLHERFEVLGMAVRFRQSSAPFGVEPRPGDTDLLTATIRSPLTMALSPLFTDASDFAGNTYWAVSPFEYDGERFEVRLVPADPMKTEGTRTERLLDAVDAGRAVWWVETRRTLRLTWHSIARIALTRELTVDQEALRFDPFRGVLRPVGFVHAIRRAVYAASQHGRPSHA
jgi:hypothetical protein